MDESKRLISIIRMIISEDLGKMKSRTFKGYGQSQPYYSHSDRPSLGTPGKFEDDQIQWDEYDEKLPIKLSKAFKKRYKDYS